MTPIRDIFGVVLVLLPPGALRTVDCYLLQGGTTLLLRA